MIELLWAVAAGGVLGAVFSVRGRSGLVDRTREWREVSRAGRAVR